jgi:hypothetical protein
VDRGRPPHGSRGRALGATLKRRPVSTPDLGVDRGPAFCDYRLIVGALRERGEVDYTAATTGSATGRARCRSGRDPLLASGASSTAKSQRAKAWESPGLIAATSEGVRAAQAEAGRMPPHEGGANGAFGPGCLLSGQMLDHGRELLIDTPHQVSAGGGRE